MKKIIAFIVLVSAVMGCRSEEYYKREFLFKEMLCELSVLRKEYLQQQFLNNISVISLSLSHANTEMPYDDKTGILLDKTIKYRSMSSVAYEHILPFHDTMTDEAREYIKTFPEQYYTLLDDIEQYSTELKNEWSIADKEKKIEILNTIQKSVGEQRFSLKPLSDERVGFLKGCDYFQFYPDFEDVFMRVYSDYPDEYREEYEAKMKKQ